jgi:uncharacterized protein YodC (DUF2158 family)
MKTPEFKIGDVVIIWAGGPKMTVVQLTDRR